MASLTPPFRAEDMEGLYKKVVKGVYKRLPGHFSVDLNDFINYMMKVNPKARYSASEILSLPTVIEKIKNGVNLKETVDEQRNLMLQTIRMPNNINHLSEKLPKPNYEPIKMNVMASFEGFSSYPGVSGDKAMVRKRSAVASKAQNRSVAHDRSDLHEHSGVQDAHDKSGIENYSSVLPDDIHERSRSRSPLLRGLNHGNNSKAHENSVVQSSILRVAPAAKPSSLVKDRINRQHDKVEQQIKKYDELLKKNRVIRQHYHANRRPYGNNDYSDEHLLKARSNKLRDLLRSDDRQDRHLDLIRPDPIGGSIKVSGLRIDHRHNRNIQLNGRHLIDRNKNHQKRLAGNAASLQPLGGNKASLNRYRYDKLPALRALPTIDRKRKY